MHSKKGPSLTGGLLVLGDDASYGEGSDEEGIACWHPLEVRGEIGKVR